VERGIPQGAAGCFYVVLIGMATSYGICLINIQQCRKNGNALFNTIHGLFNKQVVSVFVKSA
jgi:hypothetical protein